MLRRPIESTGAMSVMSTQQTQLNSLTKNFSCPFHLFYRGLRQMEASLEEAARVCGAGPWQTFRRIVLPILAPALFTTFLAGLIRGLESFQVELLLGTPAGITVYATRIFELIGWDPPLFSQAMALSTLFLAFFSSSH